VTEPAESMGSIERTTNTGLAITVADNAATNTFEAVADGAVVGRQPYRRYHTHIVLMRTEVDSAWRERGISSAMIDGVLGLIREAGSTVVPYCKLTSDYILRHPEYRDMVTEQYTNLLRPISRPGIA
jgi:predicted GNAT family acetyltransferase